MNKDYEIGKPFNLFNSLKNVSIQTDEQETRAQFYYENNNICSNLHTWREINEVIEHNKDREQFECFICNTSIGLKSTTKSVQIAKEIAKILLSNHVEDLRMIILDFCYRELSSQQPVSEYRELEPNPEFEEIKKRWKEAFSSLSALKKPQVHKLTDLIKESREKKNFHYKKLVYDPEELYGQPKPKSFLRREKSSLVIEKSDVKNWNWDEYFAENSIYNTSNVLRGNLGEIKTYGSYTLEFLNILRRELKKFKRSYDSLFHENNVIIYLLWIKHLKAFDRIDLATQEKLECLFTVFYETAILDLLRVNTIIGSISAELDTSLSETFHNIIENTGSLTIEYLTATFGMGSHIEMASTLFNELSKYI